MRTLWPAGASRTPMRAAVVVLDDLGGSVRMQRHALALAAEGAEVSLVGFEGRPLLEALSDARGVTCHRWTDSARATTRGADRRFMADSVRRAAAHAARLLARLLRGPRPDLILVQNPPAVPALSVSWLAARLRGSRLVIDWQNLSHTQAAARLGESHPVARSVARTERRWARRADAHLAVSHAMAQWLAREYRVTAAVVPERPLRMAGPVTAHEAAALWARMGAPLSRGDARTPLVVCPTDWTHEEDLDLLLEAVERADRSLVRLSGSVAHALTVALAGRGALRDGFEARVIRRGFKRVAVHTPSLDSSDVRRLIGMADLGLSLRLSTSGLDLPPALADFRAAGVPVLALDYGPVLAEVITDGHEGAIFREPGELASVLVEMATGSESPDRPLARARTWLASHPPELWTDVWRQVARATLIGS